jgi:hypothetical protein
MGEPRKKQLFSNKVTGLGAFIFFFFFTEEPPVFFSLSLSLLLKKTKMTQQQDERIGYFSTLCQELYNPKSPSERDQVQKILEASFPTFSSSDTANIEALVVDIPSFGIANPTDTANALRILLENSPNPYVQTFCLSRLKQLVMAQFTIFDRDTKLQLRKGLHYDDFVMSF